MGSPMEKAESRGVLALAAAIATLLLMPYGGAAPAVAAAATNLGRNCTSSCGNISIPYPFGVEPGCYLKPGFNLTCDRSHRPPRLFLGDGTVQVLEISIPNATVRIKSVVVKFPGGANVHGTWGGALGGEGWPYSLAIMKNKLVATLCNVQVLLIGDHNQTVSACSVFCNETHDGGIVIYVAGHCSGIGCCQADILVPRSFYGFQVIKMNEGRVGRGWASIVESEFNADPNDLP